MSIYVTARELQEITGFSKARANKTIQECNRKIREQGGRTFRGKTPRSFLEKYLFIDLTVQEEQK